MGFVMIGWFVLLSLPAFVVDLGSAMNDWPRASTKD